MNDDIVKALRLCVEKEESFTSCATGQCDCPFGETVIDCEIRMKMAAADALSAAHARIAELELKLESKEMGYSALQESYVNSVMDIGWLQLRYNEAMELLELAVADAEYLAYLVKNAGGKCDNCHKSDKSRTQSSDCWRWQHADRYDALRGRKDETKD